MVNERLTSQIYTALSKESKIILAYILGSVVRGRAGVDSDFDLAIVVEDIKKIDYKYVYELVFPIKLPKDLDLSVVDKSSSPLFLFQIISTGKCVYQKSGQEKVLFEAFVLRNYYDTSYIRNIYYSYLKDKFPYAN